MSQITHDQYLRLEALGKAPISLPAEIFFGGDERLQKSPGAHHLAQYRKTGTYDLPQLKEWRLRVAKDQAKRLLNSKMSEVELRKVGGIGGLQEKLKEHGLTINKEQWAVAEMHAKYLSLEAEAKKKDKEDMRIKVEETTGKKLEEIAAEPVNPHEDFLSAAIASATAKVTGDDDLSSLQNEDEKDGNGEVSQGAQVQFEASLDS